MDLEAFKGTISWGLPPQGLTPPLTALWWSKKGDWELAHKTAQGDDSSDAAWVHGYLHRVEGDLDNAGYWYGQAGRAPSTLPLDEEWERIASTLLASLEVSA